MQREDVIAALVSHFGEEYREQIDSGEFEVDLMSYIDEKAERYVEYLDDEELLEESGLLESAQAIERAIDHLEKVRYHHEPEDIDTDIGEVTDKINSLRLEYDELLEFAVDIVIKKRYNEIYRAIEDAVYDEVDRRRFE